HFSFSTNMPSVAKQLFTIFSSVSRQGRNLSGQVGLFPRSYTTAALPPEDTPESQSPNRDSVPQPQAPLQPLQEESEPESEPINVSSSVAPPTTSATILVNGNNETGNGNSQN